MTKKEYYDLLLQSAEDGTFPSVDQGICKYRAPNGSKCAAGLLIPDEKYTPELEGKCPAHPLVLAALEIPEGMDLLQIRWCQFAHDDANVGEWDKETFLREINQLGCFQEFQPQ